MGGWRRLAAAGAVLALAGTTAITAMPAGAVTATAATGQPPVPCPRTEVKPPAHLPAPPQPPPPGDREIGGAVLASPGLVVPPGAPPVPADQLSATSWLVADLDTGAVLGACGAHEYGIPASTIKLLLALTLLDKLDPDDVVEVIRDDLETVHGTSTVGLLDGGEYTVETLWHGLLLNSGNDAANALARIGGGAHGVAGTLAAMNATARQIGAHQTHAATPSGLDGPGQFTSAYDLALIARPLFDHDVFLRYIATERAEVPAQPPEDPAGFEIQNNNRLLYNYDGALGGKTGFTDLARQTFVGAAERDGRRLVVTLLGAERQPVPSWRQGAALLDWGFAVPPEASVGQLVEPAELTATALVPDLADPADGVSPVRAPPQPVDETPVSVLATTGSVLGGLGPSRLGLAGLGVMAALGVGLALWRRRAAARS
jgi:serine-type D-Ala-D-Ala carboxypeptidase (penicillin-binding protein 5/6)